MQLREFKLSEAAEFDQDRCVICLEKFFDKQVICALSCQHLFHRRCIASWLQGKEKANMNCPVCNKNILQLELPMPGLNAEDMELQYLQQNLAQVLEDKDQPSSTHVSINEGDVTNTA